MPKSAVAQHTHIVKGFELRITARNVDDNLGDIYSDLIIRTVKLWVYLATQIEKGVKELPEPIAHKSAEESVASDIHLDETMGGFEFMDMGEKRVTVFDWNHRLNLTLHSDTIAQDALNIFWAMDTAKQELATLYPQETAAKGSNSSATVPSGTSAPQVPAAPTDGVIVATRAPSPNAPQYSDGQLVSFTVNKIVAGSNQGSATFAMWGPLGIKYALVTVYKTDNKGQPKRDFENMLPVLNAINLSFEKPEANGNWRMVCKATHSQKDGKTKEYMNLISLTPA